MNVFDSSALLAYWPSLADRLCLPLGDWPDADVWTADAAWASEDRVQLIRTGG